MRSWRKKTNERRSKTRSTTRTLRKQVQASTRQVQEGGGEARKKLSGLEAARDSAVKEAQAAETRAQKATADFGRNFRRSERCSCEGGGREQTLARADEEAKAAQATLSQAEAEQRLHKLGLQIC